MRNLNYGINLQTGMPLMKDIFTLASPNQLILSGGKVREQRIQVIHSMLVQLLSDDYGTVTSENDSITNHEKKEKMQAYILDLFGDFQNFTESGHDIKAIPLSEQLARQPRPKERVVIYTADKSPEEDDILACLDIVWNYVEQNAKERIRTIFCISDLSLPWEPAMSQLCGIVKKIRPYWGMTLLGACPGDLTNSSGRTDPTNSSGLSILNNAGITVLMQQDEEDKELVEAIYGVPAKELETLFPTDGIILDGQTTDFVELSALPVQ